MAIVFEVIPSAFINWLYSVACFDNISTRSGRSDCFNSSKVGGNKNMKAKPQKPCVCSFLNAIVFVFFLPKLYLATFKLVVGKVLPKQITAQITITSIAGNKNNNTRFNFICETNGG